MILDGLFQEPISRQPSGGEGGEGGEGEGGDEGGGEEEEEGKWPPTRRVRKTWTQ